MTQVKRNALHRWSRWLLLALLPVLATIAMARESRVPGGIAWIDLGARTGALAPTAWFDEHRVMVNPVLLGKGTPLFKTEDKLNLELLRTRAFGNGNVLLCYAPGRK